MSILCFLRKFRVDLGLELRGFLLSSRELAVLELVMAENAIALRITHNETPKTCTID